MYLGGNGFYWVTSFDPERPHVIEVRRGQAARATGSRRRASATTARPASWAGCGAIGAARRSARRRRLRGAGLRPSHRTTAAAAGSYDPRAALIFEGVGADEPIGDFGLVGRRRGRAGDRPLRPGARLTAPRAPARSSEGHTSIFTEVRRGRRRDRGRHGRRREPDVRTDMVFFTTPAGGAVFSTGSIAWCASLSRTTATTTTSRASPRTCCAGSRPTSSPVGLGGRRHRAGHHRHERRGVDVARRPVVHLRAEAQDDEPVGHADSCGTSWLMNTTPTRCSRRRSMNDRTISVCLTPSAAVGSSSMTMWLPHSTARAIATACRCPPESEVTFVPGPGA